MIDLIEKIHELKDYENYDYDQAITDVEILLDQYNIITAPKTIKLSEIVERLQKHHSDEKIYFNEKLNAIGSGEFDDTWFANTWIPCVYFQDNKIYKIITLPCEATKWLYALWIAGTIIEDDLQEDE